MAGSGDKGIWRKVVWCGERKRFDIDCFDLLRPCREVQCGGRFRSGVFRSAKCGREIQYESGLELDFVKRLERDDHVVFYWDQPVRIPFRCGKRRLYYTPDFGVWLASGRFVLVEVKDLPAMLDDGVQLKIEALMEFCRERGFGVLLTNGRHGPDRLLAGRVNHRLERELLAAIGRGCLNEASCRELTERCNARTAELYRAVIRLRLRLRLFPLKLRTESRRSIFRQVFFEHRRYDDLPENQTQPFQKKD